MLQRIVDVGNNRQPRRLDQIRLSRRPRAYHFQFEIALRADGGALPRIPSPVRREFAPRPGSARSAGLLRQPKDLVANPHGNPSPALVRGDKPRIRSWNSPLATSSSRARIARFSSFSSIRL